MPENKPHVLFLPGWYPNRNNPNLGNFIQRHAEAINPFCKLTVLNIAKDYNSKHNKTELVEESINGVKTITVYYGEGAEAGRMKNKKVSANLLSSIFHLPSLIINLFSFWDAFFKGWKYITSQSGKPDIIHVNIAYPTGVFAIWIRIFSKIPYIISEHWSAYMPMNRHKLSWFAGLGSKIIFSNASMVMPVSKSLKEAIKQDYAPNANFTIVPNTVDVSVFYPRSVGAENFQPLPPQSHNKKRLLHVSTLDEEAKNVFGLFRAIRNLSLMRNDFELHIIHEYYSKQHEDYARELGLLDIFVFFHGHKTHEEVAEAMRNSDFFVLFSNYESFSVVLLESLASGLPVIATNVGGIPDFIHEDCGILVKPNDEVDLLNALKRMLDHYKDYDSNKLRDYVLKNFSNEVVGKSFREIYDEVRKEVIG